MSSRFLCLTWMDMPMYPPFYVWLEQMVPTGARIVDIEHVAGFPAVKRVLMEMPTDDTL